MTIKLKSTRGKSISTYKLQAHLDRYGIDAECTKVKGKAIWHIHNDIKPMKIEVKVITYKDREYYVSYDNQSYRYDRLTPALEYILNTLEQV